MIVAGSANWVVRARHYFGNKTKLHRHLKWFWIFVIPISYWWRESIFWVVFMSHYAIIASHWAAEEASPEDD